MLDNGARDLERFRKFHPTFATQSKKLTSDNCMPVAKEVAPLPTDRHEFDCLIRVLSEKCLRGLRQGCIEGTTQTLIGSDQDHQIALVAALIEQRMMKVLISALGELA